MRAIVEWGVEHQKLVESVEALDEVLDALAAQGEAQIVQVTRDEAGTLGIVLGAPRSFLHHVPVHLQPPYFASRGEQAREEMFEFFIAGSARTEVPWIATIPVETARAAVRAFVENGERPAEIAWVEA